MATINVQPGICGMKSVIHAESDDGQTCRLTIDTPCDAVQALVADLQEVDGFSAAFSNFADNPVYQAAGRHFKHAACPLPSAIIKAVEVACELALPETVNFEIYK